MKLTRNFLVSLPIISLLFFTLLLASPRAYAGQTTANLPVTATVINNCTIGAPPTLAFTGYDPTSATDLKPTAVISVTCTKNDAITVALGNGNNFSGGLRRLKDGSSQFMNYHIFKDSGLTTEWNSSNTNAGTSSSATTPLSFTAFGDAPASQDLAASTTFTDTVLITVTF